MDITILGIESSCDDTSAAVLRNNVLLSNVIASQAVHVKYGGVIPELASRAHQQNIIPVVDTALKEAGVAADRIDAIAFTRGPGLVGSLLVGVSFTKGLSIARNIPMVEVNHLQGHILSHFIDLRDRTLPHPDFPFLCLLVSGGHTQIVRVDSPLEMEIIGTTIDDAAGEAFDKCAKVMGLPYPGGPVIDRLAKEGDPKAFRFAHPRVEGYDYSFSGLKTSFLYTLRDAVAADPDFIETHKADLCASLQGTIVEILLDKLTDLDVVTTQAAEIFYKHGCCFSLLQLLNHIGKAGAIHRNAGDAVVKKMNQVRVAFFLCYLGKQFFLIPYAVALAVHVIVTGKPLIQKGGHVTGFFVVIRLFHAVLLSGQPNSNTCIPQQVYHCLALLSCMRRRYAPPPGTTPPQIPISSGAEGRSPMCSASPP